MSLPSLDWSRAEWIHGGIVVPWVGVPDPRIVSEAFSILEVYESETRGQRWEHIHVSNRGIKVSGLEPDGSDALKTYMAEIIEGANRQAATVKREHDAAMQRAQEAGAAERAKQDEAVRRLRDGA